MGMRSVTSDEVAFMLRAISDFLQIKVRRGYASMAWGAAGGAAAHQDMQLLEMYLSGWADRHIPQWHSSLWQQQDVQL
jgi:hypothetical protein